MQGKYATRDFVKSNIERIDKSLSAMLKFVEQLTGEDRSPSGTRN